MRWIWMVLLVCGGCGPGTATGATSGRRAVLPVTSLRAHETGAVDHEGVGVVAGIITWDSARRYKDAMVVVHWLESNERMPTSRGGSVGRVGPVAERWGEVPILPMPTIMLGIANRTNHPVRIAPAQLELVDGEGVRYAPFADLGSITGRVEEQLTGSYRGLLGAPGIRESLHSKLGTIRLLTTPVEIPAGGDWVGYVAFQLPLLSPAEFGGFVDRVGRLELRFTDDRGTVQLGFDKVVAGLQVTCPDDEKATLERCPPGGAMPKPSPQGP